MAGDDGVGGKDADPTFSSLAVISYQHQNSEGISKKQRTEGGATTTHNVAMEDRREHEKMEAASHRAAGNLTGPFVEPRQEQ